MNISRRSFVKGLAVAGVAIALTGQTCNPGRAHAAAYASNGKTAAELVAAMALRERITQMIMPAIRNWQCAGESEMSEFTVMNGEVADLIKDYGFAGLALFRENITYDAEQSVRLTEAIQDAAASGGHPGFMFSVDQEGGTVYRMSGGCSMTSAMALTATGDPACAYAAAEVMAEELAAIGISNDAAPVCDVNIEPNNPVIGVRSFSDDPATVATYSSAYHAGLASQGIAGTAKHFPGHGDTAVDSHVGLPRVDKTLAELQECELIPFQAAIDDGIELIMTAHIQFPQIEKGTYVSKLTSQPINLPATMSKTILTDLLRDAMGFEGVVITDSLVMDAISTHFEPLDAAALIINAGADILLMVHTMTNITDAREFMKSYLAGIEGLVKDGTIPESRINESAERIIQFKLNQGIIGGTDPRTLDQKIADAKATVGSAEHHATERVIAQKSITMIKNDGALPFAPKSGQLLTVVVPDARRQAATEWALDRLVSEGVLDAGVSISVLPYMDGTAQYTDPIMESVQNASYVICESLLNAESDLDPSSGGAGTFDEVIKTANALNIPIVLMSIHLPYDVARYQSANAVLATYNYIGINQDASGAQVGCYGTGIPAAFDTIFNVGEPAGTLPVDIPAITSDWKYSTDVAFPRGYGIIGYAHPEPTPTPTPTPTPSSGSGSSSTSVTAKTGDSTPAAAVGVLGAVGAVAAVAAGGATLLSRSDE